MTLKRRQEHGYMFEEMVKEHLDLDPSDDLKFDFVHEGVSVQIKTTGGNSLRLGRYRNGLEISKDFYLVYAKHKDHEIIDIKSYLVDGLTYNRQFSFSVQNYFDQYIKPLPDRSGKYQEYCSDLKFMAKERLVTPEVKKGGGGNNRLQSYLYLKDIDQLGKEVDLGLNKFLQKTFEIA